MLRLSARFLFVLLLAGCSPTQSSQAPNRNPVTGPALGGVIVVVRPIYSRGPTLISPVLARLGGSRYDVGDVEYVVRRADGALLSVVQAPDANLRPGSGVRIEHDGTSSNVSRTRIAALP